MCFPVALIQGPAGTLATPLVWSGLSCVCSGRVDPGACRYFGNVFGLVRLVMQMCSVALIQGPAGTLAMSLVLSGLSCVCSGRVDPGGLRVPWQRLWSCQACHVFVPVALIQGPAGTLATSLVLSGLSCVCSGRVDPGPAGTLATSLVLSGLSCGCSGRVDPGACGYFGNAFGLVRLVM